MIPFLAISILLVFGTFAGNAEKDMISPKKCTLFPGAVGSYGKLVCGPEKDPSIVIGPLQDNMRSRREAENRFKNSNRYSGSVNQHLKTSKELVESFHQSLKNAYTEHDPLFLVGHLCPKKGLRWRSDSRTPGYCVPGTWGQGLSANFVSWNVAGFACKFTLYHNTRCRGKIVHGHYKYKVLDMGTRRTPEFKSIYFGCEPVIKYALKDQDAGVLS